MRKPKKPKLAKYPKLPKSGANLATLKRYEQRCKEVDARNREKIATYNRKISEIAQAKSLREKLVRQKSSGHKTKYPHLKVA